MHQHQQATDYGKECRNYKFLLLRVTLLFCHSVLPSWQGMGEPKTEVLILSSDNLDVCSCLYLSRAEVETLSTPNGWAWVSSGDALAPSFLPFPGEDILAEWKYHSCVLLIWRRIRNCFFYQSVWRRRAGNMSSPTILCCLYGSWGESCWTGPFCSK